jgi:hypothetical protein
MKKKLGSIMKHTFVIIGILIYILLTTTLCMKNEVNPVGSELFPKDKGYENHSVFYAANSDTSFETSVNTGESLYLYLGNTQNDQALSLITFPNLPDSGTVDSAIVEIYKSQIIGTETEPFSFTVHLNQEEWDESNIMWDDFNDSFYGEQIHTDNIFLNEVDSITFRIPPNIINAWIDSSLQNNGIIFSSDAAETILEIFSGEISSSMGKLPTLSLYMNDDTTDTPYITQYTKDTFLATTQLQANKEQLLIANGIASRSILFFDIDSIPSDATINRALLTMHSDTLKSFPSHKESFILIAYPISDSLNTIPTILYETDVSGTSSLITGESLVNINITTIAQYWVSNIKENNGLILIGFDETDTISRRTFYSTSNDTLLQPTLEVFYSVPPSSRY